MEETRMDVLATLREHRLIAILRNVEREKAVPVARALYEGGVRLLEITFNQARPESDPDTGKVIAEIAAALPGNLLIGAGTVMTEEQCRIAADSGAKYALAPNVSPAVIAAAVRLGMVAIPGAMTPTEIAYAYELGAGVVKLFPAGSLGTGYIKAVRAPISHVPLLAVGGVTEANMLSFLEAGAVGVGIGANIANEELIAREAYPELTRLALRYTSQVTQ